MTDGETPDWPTLREVTEWDSGLSWIADPDEDAQRASHALLTDAGIWVVDPVDAEGLDERLQEMGEVVGVVVLQDRHTRDAATIATRHDVPVHIPEWMELGREKLEATPEPVHQALPGTDYTVQQLINTDEWEEAILVDESGTTLVVPEALGTLASFVPEEAELGVHPALDEPPQQLLDWEPEQILVGHGKSIHSGADEKMRETIEAD